MYLSFSIILKGSKFESDSKLFFSLSSSALYFIVKNEGYPPPQKKNIEICNTVYVRHNHYYWIFYGKDQIFGSD